MPPGGQTLPIWSYLVPLAFIAIAIVRNARARNLRIERLWIAPVLVIVAVAMALSHQPPPRLALIAVELAALVLGALAGWWRGRLTRITVDPETHALTSKASPAGMYLILGLFVARYALRSFGGAALHVGAPAVSDAVLLLAVGIVCAQRLEMALRATRLLEKARAASMLPSG